MPSITLPSGQVKYIPGVYTDIEVVSSLPGALPEFHVPVVVGGGLQGHSYLADANKEDNETEFTPFIALGTAGSVKDYYGAKSGLGVAAEWAKRHGLPFAFYVCLSNLTRASVIAESGAGAVSEAKIYPKKFGAPPGHVKIKCATMVLTLTPIKYFSMITENVGAGDTRIYVDDNSWIREGMTLTLGDNATTNVTKTVAAVGSELNSDQQVIYWVDLTAAFGGAGITTAQYAVALEYDTANEIVSPSYAGDAAGAVEWLNDDTEGLVGCTKEATWTGADWDDLAVAVAIKDVAAAWTGTTAGTSPAVSSGDHTAFIEDLDDAEWDNFLARHQIIPQAFLVVDSSSTNQGSWRDWAVTKRAEGYPVSITAGCAWGDTVIDAGNDTAPEFRSAALNSQDVMLCAGGLDRLAAYLSFAPAVFGRRIEGGIGHNLTNDDLVYSEVEKRWDERVSGHLTKLHKFGVVTYRMRGSRPYRYVISQGLSTLQNNSAAWNEGSDDTCLVMQRDLADYIDRVLKEDLDGKQLGADKVTPATISAVIFRKAQVLKERRGLITDFTINSVTLDASGNGYNVEWAVKLPTTTDFITCTTQILVGE